MYSFLRSPSIVLGAPITCKYPHGRWNRGRQGTGQPRPQQVSRQFAWLWRSHTHSAQAITILSSP
jgi:hypothetical protein